MLRGLPRAAVLATAVVIAAGAELAHSQAVSLVVVDVKQVATGFRTSKLLGRSVVNDRDETIGTLDDIVIGRDKVLFAVLQVGGFLGIGGHLVAVEFQSLKIDDAGRHIVLPGGSKSELKNLPEFRYAP
jgi:hypothetical protein